ncbi:hypothetical protein SDC9_184919 [bioreactor metagenome]|uniref:Uncharacterized protein n=1 Tax=bioreactor metagenome TaxID=1076179 RepID=A0A645HG90_9ZZZZ
MDEIDIDLDRAGLLLERGDIRGDAVDPAFEASAGQGLEADPDRLTSMDLGGIDLVHWRLDVKAAVVDQVDCRWCRHARR